jgi:lipopolysaccharide transport protein LptA
MQRPDSDVVTHAEAGRLDYDFEAGIIEFSDQATITEGGNQISSNYLVYNIEKQRIDARSAGEGEPRVKITYTPKESDEENGDDSTSQSEENVPDELDREQ